MIRKRMVIAVVTAATLLVAACGSDDEPKEGGSGTTVPSDDAVATNSGRGVTPETITVSGLGFAAGFGDGQAAADVRFELANENKEIPGGRTIKSLGLADNKQAPDADAQEQRRLVEQEKVFAIVPGLTNVAIGSYLNQQKVPMVGFGLSAAYCDAANKYVFAFSGCLKSDYTNVGWGAAVIAQFEAEGETGKGKTAVVISADDDTAKKDAKKFGEGLKLAGLKVLSVDTSMPAAGVTDYTPYAQNVMTANKGKPADIAFPLGDPNTVFGLSRALTEAGFKGINSNPIGYDQRMVQIAKDWSVFTNFAPAESTEPAMKEIVAALHDAGIESISQTALWGWFSADMFVEILKEVGPNLTPERFQAVAAKFSYEVPGVVGPTVYPAGFKAGTPCGALVRSDGTKYEVVAPYTCSDLLLQQGDKYVKVEYPSGVK